MKPSTNIPTPSAWMKALAHDIVTATEMGIASYAAKHGKEFFPADEYQRAEVALSLIPIIAKHAPSPSPVPTDDGLEMAAQEAKKVIGSFASGEKDFVGRGLQGVGIEVCAAIRALKGNSLPAPAMEDIAKAIESITPHRGEASFEAAIKAAARTVRLIGESK